MIDNTFDEDKKLEEISEDHIELGYLFSFFYRNKKIISLFSIVLFILGCLYSLSIKKTWEGQFQIVLNSKKTMRSNLFTANPLIGSITGFTQSNDLATEVDILKSPSVLMPIFEFAIEQDSKKSLGETTFKKWKKNKLKINLKKNTSILNISYRDTEKNDIIPVLNMITKEFQKYKGFNRKKEQKLIKEYLNNQIELYKNKSSQSLKAAQEFAIDEDLIFLQNFSSLERNENSSGSEFSNMPTENFSGGPESSNISTEYFRVKASNEIRKIDLQLKKIKDIGDEPTKLQYLGSTIPSLKLLQDKLLNLDEYINTISISYKENDPELKKKIKEKDSLLKLIKNRTIGILNTRRDDALITKESATRPKEVLLNYKALLREAVRDDRTLINLENQLRMIELENAKKESPWQLITKPTLLKKHVAPSKRQIGLVGLLLGFISGSLIALIKEKRSNKVFETGIVENITKSPFIESINLEDIDSVSDSFQYLIDFINTLEGDKIYLISLYESENKVIKKVLQLMQDSCKGKGVEIINQFSQLKYINNSEIKILLTSIEEVKYVQLNKLMKRLNTFKLSLNGFVLLNR